MRISLPDRPTVLCTLFTSVLILAAATRSPPLLAAYAAFAVYLVMSNLGALDQLGGRERVAVWLFVGVTTACLPVAVLKYEAALAHYLVGIASLFCAIVATRHLQALRDAMRVTLIGSQAILIGYSLAEGLATAPLSRLLAPHTSSNGVTSTLIMLQASYTLLHFVVARRTTLPTALVTVVICVLGYGRGSILAAALIFSVSLAFSLSRKHPWRMALLLGVLFSVGLAYSERITEYVTLNTKIGVGFQDAPREKMIEQYVARMDGVDALFGADYRGTVIDENFLGNPHNSYIRVHHMFGLFYLLALAVFVLLMIDTAQAVRVQIFAGMLLLIILARAFTEPIVFAAPFDFYLFAMCLALSASASSAGAGERAGQAPVVSPS